ncbi:MAG: cysteine hydrolase family protein [Thermodesulfobacteriota bacterium]
MKPAIVVVDLLKDAFRRKDHPQNLQYLEIVPKIKRVIDRSRERGVPIIFACDSFLENDFIFKGKKPYCLRGTEGAEVIEELKPVGKEEILLKRRFSAFFKTDLDQTFRLFGVDTVVVTGINTQVCVYATAMDSVCHDFHTIVLEDCTASGDKETHQKAIEVLKQSGLFPLLRVISSEEFLSEIKARGD